MLLALGKIFPLIAMAVFEPDMKDLQGNNAVESNCYF